MDSVAVRSQRGDFPVSLKTDELLFDDSPGNGDNRPTAIPD